MVEGRDRSEMQWADDQEQKDKREAEQRAAEEQSTNLNSSGGSMMGVIMKRLKFQGLNGDPEDIVHKPNTCRGDCLLEKLLPEDKRKIKVVATDVPENHPSREIIEQVCGKHYDAKCHIKYLFMRSGVTDYMAAQMGAVEFYAERENIEFDEALQTWGHGVYAKRWKELWDLTRREVVRDGKIVNKRRIYTVYGLSEKVTEGDKAYRKTISKEKKARIKFIKENDLAQYLAQK